MDIWQAKPIIFLSVYEFLYASIECILSTKIQMYRHKHTDAREHARTHTHTHTRASAPTCLFTHTRTHVYTHACMHIHIHVGTHAYTRMHAHVRTKAEYEATMGWYCLPDSYNVPKADSNGPGLFRDYDAARL